MPGDFERLERVAAYLRNTYGPSGWSYDKDSEDDKIVWREEAKKLLAAIEGDKP